jgi:uncharacterized protein YdhG (YjbR/CyaY superfamily)
MATAKSKPRSKSKAATKARPKPKRAAKPTTIDQYLASVPAEQRAALQKLRATLHRIVPGAEECISYGVPGMRLGGRGLVWFAAAKSHCSFFPGAVIADYADELRGFETSKGTIRFQPERLPPEGLLRKLVAARLARAPKARVRTPRKAR